LGDRPAGLCPLRGAYWGAKMTPFMAPLGGKPVRQGQPLLRPQGGLAAWRAEKYHATRMRGRVRALARCGIFATDAENGQPADKDLRPVTARGGAAATVIPAGGLSGRAGAPTMEQAARLRRRPAVTQGERDGNACRPPDRHARLPD